MFNRSIQMRIVKTKKETKYEDLPADIRLEDAATIVSHHFDKAVRKVGQAIITYVIVDTIRQVIVAQATK